MISEGPIQIGEIEFLDLKVPVYYDPITDGGVYCVWQMRNSQCGYNGYLYMNYETGEVEYPQGASMPIQISKDTEIVPSFILTGKNEFSNELAYRIKEYLDLDFRIRNGLIPK